MKTKTFALSGLKALISRITQAMKTAEGGASAVSDLSVDFQEFAKLTNQAIKDMDKLKQDKADSVQAVLSASAWSEDETAGYPYYYDLAVEDVTALDLATVIVSPASLPEATNCGLCPTCETSDGKIRLWSASKPTADIAAEYWIEQGANPSQKEEE